MAVLLTSAEAADYSCGRAFQGSWASGRTLGVLSKGCAIGSLSHQVSIPSTFYMQLLQAQIPKVQKYNQAIRLFCTFGIW